MKTLHRYILREIFAYFVLGLFLFTFLLLLNRIFQLTELVVTKGVPLLIVGKLLLSVIPVLLLATLPMSVLIAGILVFSRLSNDSEFVAMTSSGMSLYSQLLPVSLVGILTAGLSAALMIYGLPWSHQTTKDITRELIQSRAAAFEVQEQVFNDSFDGIVIYVKKISNPGRIMRGVLISDTRDPKNNQIIFADRGMLVSDPEQSRLLLRLVRGTIHRKVAENGEKPSASAANPPPVKPEETKYQVVRFGTYEINLDLTKTIGQTRALRVSLRALPIGELRRAIATETQGSNRYNSMLVELHKKFATPFACLILALLGAPLGVQNRRSGRHGGFALSLIVLMAYYILSTFAEGMGENGTISPAVVAWGPNVLLLLIAAWATRAVVRRGAVDIFSFFLRLAGWLPFSRRAHPRAA